MIPCRSTCPYYTDGCHKSCSYWKEFQEKAQTEREAKKVWLKHENEISSTVLRQYLALSPRSCHY